MNLRLQAVLAIVAFVVTILYVLRPSSAHLLSLIHISEPTRPLCLAQSPRPTSLSLKLVPFVCPTAAR